jgi:alkanesulfonate monooxygenase SsuD/methylene tetrahydromethanopterin reductase-like flavin-dependent oxidoreductase (luciferase family)
MKFGVFLPSYLQGEPPDEHARRLRDFARHTEALGFDSLWITDHIVTAHRLYRVSWLDSLITLSHVAAITERVKLGTSILILPVRQPAVLAKEIATLHYLSGSRYIYGIGTGWHAPEFAACGVDKSERGGRTDEVLAATLALFERPDVEFHGRYYDLDGVTVEPHLNPPPPVWVAGGSQLPHERSPERPVMHPNVLRRIAESNGWIARPTAPPELIASDLKLIEEARLATAQAKPFTAAHENFVWIEETGSRDAVIAEQRRRYNRVVSDERPWEYIESVYLAGTIDEIQAKIQMRIDVGVEYMMLHTLTPDLEQLDLIARHIVEPFAGVPSPRPSPAHTLTPACSPPSPPSTGGGSLPSRERGC